MDPITRIHEDIHNLIYQHFLTDEVLLYSTVSKSWYISLGSSNIAMKKIWINLGDRFNEPTKSDVKILQRSKRKYQNFKISEMENGLQILVFPKKIWKRAKIDIQSFVNFDEYINLLEIFNETIVELSVFDMDVEATNSKCILKFPKLECLKLGFLSATAVQPFIQHHLKLRKLILENINDVGSIKKSKELMQEIINLNSNLTHLSLSSDAFSLIFAAEHTINVRLKHLIVEFSCDEETPKTILENFEKFLFSQATCLEWIVCDITCPSITFRLFNDMPAMRRITFDYFDVDSPKVIVNIGQLRKNSNVLRLDFDCDNLTLEWMKPFLECAIDLQILYVFHLTQDIIDYACRNLKKLCKIYYCSIDNKCVFYYEKILSHDTNINRNIVLHEEKFTDFRKLF